MKTATVFALLLASAAAFNAPFATRAVGKKAPAKKAVKKVVKKAVKKAAPASVSGFVALRDFGYDTGPSDAWLRITYPPLTVYLTQIGFVPHFVITEGSTCQQGIPFHR